MDYSANFLTSLIERRFVEVLLLLIYYWKLNESLDGVVNISSVVCEVVKKQQRVLHRGHVRIKSVLVVEAYAYAVLSERVH